MGVVFTYEARDRSGRVLSGSLEGENERAVRAVLRKEGYIVTALSEKKKAAVGSIDLFQAPIKIRDMAIFAKQFSTMINAGLPLVKSLDILAKQTESKRLAEVIGDVKQEVEQGKSLSEAMRKHKKVFPELMISMVEAGEVGGVLDDVLERVSIYLEKDNELRAKVKSAMKYPAFVITVAIGVLCFVITNVIPQFADMFADLGADLPLLTKILMATSDFLIAYWWALLLGVGAIGFSIYKYVQTDQGTLNKDRLFLKLPVIGDVVRKSVVAKFTQTFGTLLRTGVPMVAAMEMVARSSGNKVVELAMFDVVKKIKEGSTLSIPLEKTNFFPPMVIHMVSIGEETGTLDNMLIKVSDFYEKEVAIAVDGLKSLLEPMITVGLGGIIGLVVVAVMMPMLTLAQHVQ